MSIDALKNTVIMMDGAALEHVNEKNAAQAKRIQQLEAELAAARFLASEGVSALLWLYRRLPHCYCRPPFVEEPIVALAKFAGSEMFCINESFAERNTTAPDRETPCGS